MCDASNVRVRGEKKMFANNEITDRGLFHRLLARAGNEDAMADREALAARDRRRDP